MHHYVHHGYYHPAYGGETGWVVHSIVSAMIHAVIYGSIFRLMRQLSLSEGLVIVGIVLIGAYVWARHSDQRGRL